jgi:hypothetical protein
MMAFLAALLVMIGIGFGAAFSLDTLQRTVDNKYQTEGVRLDPEPGLQSDKPGALKH